MITLDSTKISGEGLVYPLHADGVRLEVLVALTPDGDAWRVRFDVEGNQYGGHGCDPRTAYKVAGGLAREALAGRGVDLDVEGIESTLAGQRALDTEVEIPLLLTPLCALGIKHSFPHPVDPIVVEKHFRDAEFMRRTQGIWSPHWKVIGTAWDDYGRELCVTVRLGR